MEMDEALEDPQPPQKSPKIPLFNFSKPSSQNSVFTKFLIF